MTGPSPAPTCYRHPGRETYVRCARCDRPICTDCMTEAAVGFQCPTCVAEGRATQRATRTWFGGTDAGQHGYVTIGLIGVNVLVFLLSLVVSRGQAMGGGGLFGGHTLLHDWFALRATRVPLNGDECIEGYLCNVTEWAPGVDDGAYYRLVTSMFLHFGPIHLAMNMWALWILGRNLELAFGPLRFAALYTLSGLGGSVAVYLLADPSALTAGASGAIFGLFGALVIVLRKLGRSLATIVPVLIANVIFTFAVPGISIAGHLGGLATGALVGAGLAYAPVKNRTPIQLAVMIGMGAVLLFFTAVGALIGQS